MIKPLPRPGKLTAVACTLVAVALLALPALAHAETCPNEEFRTGAGATLPDCRAYELVTPPFTEASTVELGVEQQFGLSGFTGMSADGSQVGVTSIGNFGDSHAVFEANDYELVRTESGWSETNIDIPVSRFPAGYVAAQEEYFALRGRSNELFSSPPLRATPDFGKFLYYGLYNNQVERSSSFWIVEDDGVPHRLGPGEGNFVGASTDLSHVLFESGGEGGALEEDQYVAGQEFPGVPVGVEPSGSPCAASLAANDNYFPEERPISAGGSTVFFTCSGELFARLEESRSVAISEPSRGDCEACDTEAGVPPSPTFDGASADGSKVFFTTTQPLLGPVSETSANLYEYDFDAPQASPGDPDGRMIRVTAGEWGAGGAQVQGVVGVSEDGSHVYFTAGGVLSGAVNNQGQSPREGGANQYVYDTETGRTAFIATAPLQSMIPEVFTIPSDITPDGRFFVFGTSVDITQGDTGTANQIFEYDAETGDLVRVSVGQDGFNDNGNTDTERLGSEIPRQYPGHPVAVSNDGAYVVFESRDGLTPGALNGVNGAENVYEYHDGNVYLVSDGQDTTLAQRLRESFGSSVLLYGMSPSGDDIFFRSGDQLVPQALGTGTAIYDARIGGGFPAPVSLLPTCTGDACQGALSSAPVLLSPGSEFQAGGNQPLAASEVAPAVKAKARSKPAKCKKGYVKKKTRCVKKAKTRAKKSAKGRK